jgi:hypothetical protein
LPHPELDEQFKEPLKNIMPGAEAAEKVDQLPSKQ